MMLLTVVSEHFPMVIHDFLWNHGLAGPRTPEFPGFPDVMAGAKDVRNTQEPHGNEQNAPQCVQGAL